MGTHIKYRENMKILVRSTNFLVKFPFNSHCYQHMQKIVFGIWLVIEVVGKDNLGTLL